MNKRQWREAVLTILLILTFLSGFSFVWFFFEAAGILNVFDSNTLNAFRMGIRLGYSILLLLFVRSFLGLMSGHDSIPNYMREGDRRPFDVPGIVSYAAVMVVPVVWYFLIPELEVINKRTPGLRDPEQEYAAVLFSWCMILVGTFYYSFRRIRQTEGHLSSYSSTLLIGLIPVLGGNYLMITTWMAYYEGWEPLWNTLIIAAPILYIFGTSRVLHKVHEKNKENEL